MVRRCWIPKKQTKKKPAQSKTITTLYRSACFFALHRSEHRGAHSCDEFWANIAEAFCTAACNIKKILPRLIILITPTVPASPAVMANHRCARFNTFHVRQSVFLLSCQDSTWKLFLFITVAPKLFTRTHFPGIWKWNIILLPSWLGSAVRHRRHFNSQHTPSVCIHQAASSPAAAVPQPISSIGIVLRCV